VDQVGKINRQEFTKLYSRDIAVNIRENLIDLCDRKESSYKKDLSIWKEKNLVTEKTAEIYLKEFLNYKNFVVAEINKYSVSYPRNASVANYLNYSQHLDLKKVENSEHFFS